MHHEIRNRYTGAVLFSGEYESFRACAEAAVSAETNLRGAHLSNANLRGAHLSNANLYGAHLSNANLYGANLYGADLSNANLRGADLRDADLRGAHLSNAHLYGADLSNANLRGADLSNANLYGAHLYGAHLSNAHLIDAGHDRRGFCFWAWRNKDGAVVYRAGCQEWTDYAEAVAWYGEGYKSTGDRHECLARLTLLRDEAARRWPVEAKQEAA